MLVKTSSEPKFYKYFQQASFKYSHNQTRNIKQRLNSQTMEVQYLNPFLANQLPNYNKQQLAPIVLHLAKQMDQLNIRSFNIVYLQAFIQTYLKDLVQVLAAKEFHCEVFCLAMSRFLQEFIRNNVLVLIAQKIKKSLIVDLLLKTYCQISHKKLQSNACNLVLLEALLGYASVKYICQLSEDYINQEDHISKALKISTVLITLVENERLFEAVRDFVGYTTHLVIFNSLKMQPTEFYEFCLYKHQEIQQNEKKVEEKISPAVERQFYSSLQLYAKLDPFYLDSLLKLVKNLLLLRIKTQAITKPFSVLIQIVKSRPFPQLKLKIYKMLVEVQHKRNCQQIDLLYEELIDADPEICTKETQASYLRLAIKGNKNIKQKFVQLYYGHAIKNNKRLQASTVNFIFQVNLDLNLELPQFQLFLGRQAIFFEAPALKKLHQAISLRKNKAFLNFLDIILGKKLQKSLKNPKQLDLSCSFLQQDWLQAAGDSFQAYQIYLKTIVATVGQKTIQIKPELINLSSCILKIQNGYFPLGLKYYRIISKMATKHQVFSANVFKYMLICQAVFGDKLEIGMYEYFYLCFSKIDDDQLSEVIFLLQYLVRILKNRSSVLIYFQAILQFQRSKPSFYNQKLYDIQFLVDLIYQSSFFRLSTFSMQALTILQQLTIIIKDQSFHQHATAIFKAWTSLLNRNECNNFFYLFCFRQMKKIFPYMREKEGKNNKQRISQLWKLMIKLMDEKEQPCQFLKTLQNKITIHWEGDQAQFELKKGLLIEGDILQNQNIQLNSNIFTLNTSVKSYQVELSNDKCFIYQKLNSQNNKELWKQSPLKELKKRVENLSVSLKVQQHWNQKGKTKATITISGQQFQIPYEGYLQSVLFQINSQAFIKNLSIKNTVTSDSLTNIKQHLNSLNLWSVKVSSLSKIVITSFISKVDFEMIFYLLGQTLKNFKQFSISQGFTIFIRLSCKLFKHLKQSSSHLRGIPREIQVMKKVFSLVRKAIVGIKCEPIKFTLQLQRPTQYCEYLYYLYVAALFPDELWKLFSNETKKYLIQLLIECLKCQQFQRIQNSNIQLFELLCGLDYDFQTLSQIRDEIILNHQPDKILTLKFEHYITLAQYSHQFSVKLSNLLSELIECILSDNLDSIKKKTLCKFLIVQSTILDIVFTFCYAHSKISLIHYIVNHPIQLTSSSSKTDKLRPQKQQIQKIKELVGTMTNLQRSQFIPLLIIEIKQDSLPKSFKRRLSNSLKKASSLDSSQNFLEDILYINLYLLVKLWDSINGDILDDVVIVLYSYLKQRVALQEYYEVIHLQTENTLCTQEYVEYLYKIKTQFIKKHQKHKEIFNQIFRLSLELISRSQKKKFLKFMKHYFEFAIKDLSFAFLPLQTQNFKDIQLYSHAVILQYIYQVLIEIKYNSCFQDEQQIDQFCKFAIRYVEFFIVNIQFACEVQKPLVYVYPKLVALKQPNVEKLVGKIRQVQKQPYLQLKGGLYFKLILIVLQLLESCIQINFISIIELLLLKKDSTKKSMHSSRHKQSNSTIGIMSKELTSLQRQLNQFDQQHRQYYLQIQRGSQKDIPNPEYDLSSSLMQFFLMRLCEFLQNYSEILQATVLQSYSSLIISYLKHPKISKEISQENQFSPYEILKYQDILYLLDSQNDSSLKSPYNIQAFTPSSPKKINFASAFGFSNGLIDGPASPPKLRKRSMSFSNMPKQRLQLYEQLTKDPRKWSKVPKKINFAKLFGVRPKEIRFVQFLHIHNVLKRQPSHQLFFEVDKSSQIAAFVKKHNHQLKNLKSKAKEANAGQNFALRKIKKIYPYTCPSKTVMRIMQICLPNMACPITELVQCKDYSLRKNSKESLNMLNYFQEDEDYNNSPQQSLEGSFKDYFDQVELMEEDMQQSAVYLKKYQQFCELVTREGVYFCQIDFRQSQKVLKLKSIQTRPDSSQFPNVIYGSPPDNLIRKGQVQFIIRSSQIQEIISRKFALIYNSIEIFLKNGTSKFIMFYDRHMIKIIGSYFYRFNKQIKIIRDPVKQFQQFGYTQKWIQGSLSNFDYIMLLNKYSGRTHNDINQYYVFPWVLKDYHSEKLDLSDTDIYRDFSKPIGAQNPEKLKRFKQIHKSNMGTHYYGSHYSTSLFVLYYLVRLEPFSTLHRDMQKGTFDHADRLFSSVFQVWDNLMSESATSDIKELIPQFYYMPALLKNIGDIQFGQKMCGQVVGDVALPPWASTPQQFVLTMRAALQSDWVSENLHLWIDLIFGKHQCSQEKYNVFISLTYQQKVHEILKQLSKDPKQLQPRLQQIIYFGQCPSRLFNKEHKPKKLNIDSLPNRSSLKLKKPLSQTTSSQYQHDQVLIGKEWRCGQIFIQHNKFCLQLQSKGSKKQYAIASFEYFASFDELKDSLQVIKILTKRRQQIRVKQEENKIFLDKSCLKIEEEIVTALETNFSFEKVKVNEIWIAFYGLSGLRVYNWQQQLFWKWQKEEVCQVRLQPTKMIFSTPTGKVCFYSFFDDRIQQTQAIKQCSEMQIKVITFPRNPSRMYKNQTQYKVLCVGDRQKVTIVDFLFQQTLNRTSLLFSASQ